VHTDGATSPSTSFFDIAHDCIRWPSHFTKIEFHAAGCFEATRNNGRYKVNVKYRELAELWQESLDMLPELRKRAWEDAVTMGDSLAGLVYRAIFARAVFENFGVDDLSILLGPPEETRHKCSVPTLPAHIDRIAALSTFYSKLDPTPPEC
jgi:hypothetical protein